MPHNLKNLFTGANVVGELLPLLNRIIAPELKPVNCCEIERRETFAYRYAVHRSTVSSSERKNEAPY